MRCLKIKTQDDNCEQAMKNFSLHHSKPIYFDFNLKRMIGIGKKIFAKKKKKKKKKNCTIPFLTLCGNIILIFLVNPVKLKKNKMLKSYLVLRQN